MTYHSFIETILKRLTRLTRDLNWENREYLEMLYSNYLQLEKPFKAGQSVVGGRWLQKLIYSTPGRRSNCSLEYWTGRGWTEEEAKFKISEIQKKRSKLSKTYWLQKGLSEAEAVERIAELQSKISKKGWASNIKTRSIWSVDFWLAKGYSEEEAKFEVLKRNPSSRHFYDTEEEWKEAKKRISSRVETFIRENPELYNSFFGTISKSEINFFERIKEIGIIHESFCINVLDGETKRSFKCDGYYKTSTGIILIEYDGLYWHSRLEPKYDQWRENLILEKRSDILGMVRISDKFSHETNQQELIKKIKYAIQKIESKEHKIIRLY
jgi:hypothetical protein